MFKTSAFLLVIFFGYSGHMTVGVTPSKKDCLELREQFYSEVVGGGWNAYCIPYYRTELKE